jgi:uncharacterized protein (TIGR00251 family)
MTSWYRFDADRNILCISVHVQPNARSTGIAGRHGEALKIRVAAPPLDSRANQLVIDLIAEKLGVPKSRVSLRRGRRSRAKLIEVLAPGEDALRSLGDWDA